MSVIDKVEKSLKELALSDVDKCFKGGAKVGAFILLGCLIDAATGFWKGQDTTRTDYKDFVRQYLPKCDPESLYADLRCKLVHSYSEGGSYELMLKSPATLRILVRERCRNQLMFRARDW